MSDNKNLREELADVQHAIWAHWMRYMFSCGTFDEQGNWIMPWDKARRWQRQMDTLYAELTDKERESDRDQADKVIALLPDMVELVVEVEQLRVENEQLRRALERSEARRKHDSVDAYNQRINDAVRGMTKREAQP